MLPQWISAQADSKNPWHSSCYSLTETLPESFYHLGKVPRLIAVTSVTLFLTSVLSLLPATLSTLMLFRSSKLFPLPHASLGPECFFSRHLSGFLPHFIQAPVPIPFSEEPSLTTQFKMVSSSQTFLSLLVQFPFWNIPLLDILLSICQLFVFLLEYEHHQARVFSFFFFSFPLCIQHVIIIVSGTQDALSDC